MAEWITTTLEECTDILGDGLHGTPKYTENGEYAFVNGNNLVDGEILIKKETKRVDYSQYDKYKKTLTNRTILVSINGTLGNVGVYGSEKIILGKSACYFNVKESVDKDFIYYIVSSPTFKQYLESNATGTTIKNISLKQMREYTFELPEIGEQKRISSVLRKIDEKIKNNRAINNNLLEQIKTICTAWLSEYKPFDGVMPSDWVETPLSDIAEFISGYSYKGTELTDSTIAMATIKNFDRKGGFKLDGYKEIIPSSKLKESQHAELFDTLVAHTDLTQNAEVIGNAELVMSKSGYDDIVFSMDLVKVLPKKDGVSKFLIAAILQDKKFKAHCLGYVNGTTVLHLSKKALPEYKLFLPSDFSTLKPLDEVVTALYKRVSSNISENTYLEELRESLLPKLMSGELDVSDIEI